MPIKVNLNKDQAKKSSFDPLPGGWYHMIIENLEMLEVKNEASDYYRSPRFSVEFKVTEDPRNPQDADGASEYAGRRAFGSMVIHPELMKYGASAFLEAVGALTVTEGDLDIPGPDEFDYVGRELLVRMTPKKDDKADAKKENRPVETQPNGYKSADPDAADSGPAIPATTRRRVL